MSFIKEKYINLKILITNKDYNDLNTELIKEY